MTTPANTISVAPPLKEGTYADTEIDPLSEKGSEKASETVLDTKKTSSKNKASHQKPTIGLRTASRLIAVQGLYAMDITQKRPSEVIPDIKNLHQNIVDNDIQSEEHTLFNLAQNFDLDYAVSLLRGIVREQQAIDPLISDLLPEKWPFKRIDKVMCAILRAGTYELLFSPEIPPKVVINEYTNIGSSFQLNNDNALINGVLNSIYQSQ